MKLLNFEIIPIFYAVDTAVETASEKTNQIQIRTSGYLNRKREMAREKQIEKQIPINLKR